MASLWVSISSSASSVPFAKESIILNVGLST